MFVLSHLRIDFASMSIYRNIAISLLRWIASDEIEVRSVPASLENALELERDHHRHVIGRPVPAPALAQD